MNLFVLLLIIVFLIGLYFYAKNKDQPEGFTVGENRCPNLLIQKGAKYYLYNTQLVEVPGVNPIEFNNLEDYVEFLDWQRSQNIRCPVLYLQESYNAQGVSVYKARPSVLEPQAGLPPSVAAGAVTTNTIAASTLPNNLVTPAPSKPIYPNPTLLVDATQNDPPYNKNSYPAEDQTSYYVGTTTPLDMMNIKQQSAGVSPNPMDANWGGPGYTQNLVDSGYYDANQVSLYVD
jgi:hypothetical protein